MTAFLFIPSTLDSSAARRVDFGNIASLFAEYEEPLRPADVKRNLLRAGAAALLLLLAVGDTLLVTRPTPMTGLPAVPTSPSRATL